MSVDAPTPGPPERLFPGGPPMENREVRYSYSQDFPSLLHQVNGSLLVSTYSTGNIVAVSAPRGQICVSFHTFERPMGMAARPGWLVVGSRTQVWSLRNFPDLVANINPKGYYDACYLTRFSHFTGNIQCHELAWISTASKGAGNPVGKAEVGVPELWIVNTLFSCLCAASSSYSFAPRWRPPFVSALVPEDRCHLNGLAVSDGKARYVTAMAETNSAQGWRPVKTNGGCLIDVTSNQVISRGLSMPHSPRLAGDSLFVLQSGLGRLEKVDRSSGRLDTIVELPGYARGLAIHGSIAFVGLSKVRETSLLSGVPIAAHPERVKCGFAVVDLRTGQVAAFFEFTAGIDEIFDVQFLSGVTSPFIAGPHADRGSGQPVWTVPP